MKLSLRGSFCSTVTTEESPSMLFAARVISAVRLGTPGVRGAKVTVTVPLPLPSAGATVAQDSDEVTVQSTFALTSKVALASDVEILSTDA